MAKKWGEHSVERVLFCSGRLTFRAGLLLFLCGVIAAGSIIFSANAVTFHKLSPATTMKTQTVTKTTPEQLVEMLAKGKKGL